MNNLKLKIILLRVITVHYPPDRIKKGNTSIGEATTNININNNINTTTAEVPFLFTILMFLQVRLKRIAGSLTAFPASTTTLEYLL